MHSQALIISPNRIIFNVYNISYRGNNFDIILFYRNRDVAFILSHAEFRIRTLYHEPKWWTGSLFIERIRQNIK